MNGCVRNCNGCFTNKTFGCSIQTLNRNNHYESEYEYGIEFKIEFEAKLEVKCEFIIEF